MKKAQDQQYVQIGGRMIAIDVKDENNKQINKDEISKVVTDKLDEAKKMSAKALKDLVSNIKNELSKELAAANVTSDQLALVESKLKKLCKESESKEPPVCSYSDSEAKTHRQWFGKTVYNKVIIIDKIPEAGVITEEHGIEKLDMVVNYYVMLKDANNSVFYNPKYAKSLDDICIEAKTIQFEINEDWADYTGYVVIEYTKK